MELIENWRKRRAGKVILIKDSEKENEEDIFPANDITGLVACSVQMQNEDNGESCGSSSDEDDDPYNHCGL